MSTKKRQRRIKETNEEYEAAVQSSSAQARVENAPDDILFTIDTAGSRTAKRKIASQIGSVVAGDKMVVRSFVSKADKALVKRLQLEKLNEKGNVDINNSKGKIDIVGKLGDLWGDDSIAANESYFSNKKKGGVIARIRPGQSYNPSFSDHQEALAEALALEIKNKEKRERVIEGFEKSSAHGNYGGAHDSSSDEESYDSVSDDDENKSVSDNISKKNKANSGNRLTTAQRNKEKAKKLARYLKVLAKKEKELLKDIAKAPEIAKELDREASRMKVNRELEEIRKEQRSATASYVELLEFESGLTPLSDELRGSLRTVIPKGSALTSQVNMLRSDGKVLKNRRKRRPNEKPHGAKRQVWVPKQKFHLIK